MVDSRTMPSAMTSLSSTQNPKSASDPMTPVNSCPTLSSRKSTVMRFKISRSASMATRSRRLRCSAAFCSLTGLIQAAPSPARVLLMARCTTRSA